MTHADSGDPGARGCAYLSSEHRALIAASGISGEVAAARGYRTVTVKAELKRLGFAEAQCIVPTLLVPNFNALGRIVNYQVRPDTARIVDGRPLKYETPKGGRNVVDVPPLAVPWIGDPSRPLFITEGARKADAAVSIGLCCISLPGVWSFRGRNDFGGKTDLSDWGLIALNGRPSYVVFDSDVMTKPQVHNALVSITALLKDRGADVRYIYLPPGAAGEKVGLDDFLASGKGCAELMLLARSELAPLEGTADERPAYFFRDGRTFWTKVDSRGEVAELELLNFTAQIEAEIEEDDGVEVRRSLELVATVRGKSQRCTISSTTFESLSWVVSHLGVHAVVSPGGGLRDRARAAIQLLSTDVARRTVYRHLGWREIEGHGWCYLHAAGAIGAIGAILEVETSLAEPLQRYALPPPPEGSELIGSVGCALRVLELGKKALTYPLLALVARTAIGGSNASIHLAGATGVFKTELASIVQRFWGKDMDAKHLPGSWSSTGNATESLGFYAKDALLVVDDFAPKGGASEVQRYHSQADRVIRSQANRSGRGRLRSDGSHAPIKPPRCALLSTGEEIPEGQSVRARMLTAEVARGDIDPAQLTRCQGDAAAGQYARVLAAYLRWLAADLARHQRDVAARALELRADQADTTQHRRTPDLVADLVSGFECFLRFCVSVDAISIDASQTHADACREALLQLSEHQRDHIESAEPTTNFLRLLRSSLSSGEAHVQPLTGGVPADELAVHLGWQASSSSWVPRGASIGWYDDEDLYLEPTASHKAAQRMASDSDRLSISSKTLGKRLRERGLLVSFEETKSRNTARVAIRGARRSVYHLEISHLLESTQSTRSPQLDGIDGRAGPGVGPASGPESAPNPGANEDEV